MKRLLLAIVARMRKKDPRSVSGREVNGKPSAPVKASGMCGDHITWSLYDDGQLIINGSGAMRNYMPEGIRDHQGTPPWYDCRMDIRSVRIGKEITYLGNWSFAHCKNLRKVSLSCPVEAMPWGGFFECKNLERVLLPEGVKCIHGACFSGCERLREVHLPEGLEKIGDSAFYGCKNLTGIHLPESLVEIEAHAFSRCHQLRGIPIPPGATRIHGKAFWDSGMAC